MSYFADKLRSFTKDVSDLASEKTSELAEKIKEISNEAPGQISEKTEEFAEKTKTFGKNLLNKGKVFYEGGKAAVANVDKPSQDVDNTEDIK